MSTKGPIDARIDVGALNEVIVYANQYRQEVSAKADAIRTVCRKMEDEESLKGGDGDHIRLDIVFLLGIDETVFVGHIVGTHRIKQKDQIIQCQIPDIYTLRLFYQIR